MRNFKQLQNPDKDVRKMKPAIGRDSTVKQPKGHPAAKRNQAYGGESEQQYNPLKYRKIKAELKDKGGQVMVPGKPPYKSANMKYTVTRDSDNKMKDFKPEEHNDAIQSLIKKKLEKDYNRSIKRPRTRMPSPKRDGTIKKK